MQTKDKIVEEIKNSYWIINKHLTEEKDLDEFIEYCINKGIEIGEQEALNLQNPDNRDFHVPEEHIQKGIIANTPHWLRVHFTNKGRKQLAKEIKPQLDLLQQIIHFVNNNVTCTSGIYCNNLEEIRGMIIEYKKLQKEADKNV